MRVNAQPPSKPELLAILGPAYSTWTGIIAAAEGVCAPLDPVWRPSKTGFGRLCLLQHKKRTLLYLTPDAGQVWVAIVLGERACALAMASALPAEIKTLLAEAKPYAEGRGIRFPLRVTKDLPVITQLVGIKTAPK